MMPHAKSLLFGLLIWTHHAVTTGLAVAPPPLTKTASHLPLANQAMEYLNAGTDPFHVVQFSVDLLETAGFVELSDEKLEVQPGGKYYYTKNKSTMVAFSVGQAYKDGGGFKIIGGHTDSPCLRVKPRSKRTAAGCIQLGVECYGGGLWHTWFDRDLGVSGRVLVRSSDDCKIEQRLIKVDRALLRISNLAIHLQSADERKAFAVNKEDHLSPILAMAAKKALSGDTSDSDESNGQDGSEKKKETAPKDGWSEFQEPALLQVLASELGVAVADIVDFELSLFDVQKAALGGAFSEFVHSARLDNLASCFLAVHALLHHVESKDSETDDDISMIVLYDHEEVGSTSAVGAASPILSDAVRRITAALVRGDANSEDAHDASLRRSFCLSSDQAHAVHPNYTAKHEKNHQPKMNEGMVIKRNANQRYATNAVTGVIIREICRKAHLTPVQEFVVRQDCGCGSTIGPVISANTGIRTIDMGCPQLSMHSIRETMGICDLTNGLDLFKAYFKHFRHVDDSIQQ